MMKYRDLNCEILGGPGKYYWQISGVVAEMPYSETAEETFTDSIKCAAACKRAVNKALKPPPVKKAKKTTGPPVVHGS